jgi:site-specific DNA-methyltransferase (adenine-specific)
MSADIQSVLEGRERWCVVQGDCLDVMRGLPDGCVDAVVTDPPYGLGFPYLGYDDSRDNLKTLIAGFLPEAVRLSKKRIIVLCGPTQIGLYPNPDWVGAVTWRTTATFGRAGYNQWTPVLLYGKDVDGFGNVNGMLKSDTFQCEGAEGYGFTRGEEERKHTCPKPLGLMRPVVRRYVEPGSIILDPFCGSGTTGVVAVANGYRFIGIEREASYVDIARRRIADAAAQGNLFTEAL